MLFILQTPANILRFGFNKKHNMISYIGFLCFPTLYYPVCFVFQNESILFRSTDWILILKKGPVRPPQERPHSDRSLNFPDPIA